MRYSGELSFGDPIGARLLPVPSAVGEGGRNIDQGPGIVEVSTSYLESAPELDQYTGYIINANDAQE